MTPLNRAAPLQQDAPQNVRSAPIPIFPCVEKRSVGTPGEHVLKHMPHMTVRKWGREKRARPLS